MPIRPLRVALSVLFLICTPLMGQAQQGQNDLRDRAQLIGSERLRTFTLARGLDPEAGGIGVAQDLKSLLIAQGFYLDQGTGAVLSRRQSLYPMIAYVPNMNGGLENRILELSGLTFMLDEDQAAQDGIAVGGGYDGSLRLGWSEGRYVEARYQIESLYAPEPDLASTEDRLSICARNHVRGWTFADLCLRQTRIWQDLGDRTRQEAEISLAHLFEAGERTHEITLSTGRGFQDEDRDTFVSLGLDSAFGHSATRLLMRMGTPPPEGSGVDLALLGEVRWNMNGRIAGLTLSAARSADVPFLGQERRDVAFGVSGLYQIQDNALLTLAWRSNDSTVDFFDTETVRVEVSFPLR